MIGRELDFVFIHEIIVELLLLGFLLHAAWKIIRFLVRDVVSRGHRQRKPRDS